MSAMSPRPVTKLPKPVVMVLGTLISAAVLAGCASSGNERYPYRQYDYNRPDPQYGYYDASRYYRDEPTARERKMANRERVYRGDDGKYYCRRNSGTTGLIVGAIAGGFLGDAIAPRGSKTLGAIIGAGGGGVAGRALTRGDTRCR